MAKAMSPNPFQLTNTLHIYVMISRRFGTIPAISRSNAPYLWQSEDRLPLL